VGDCELVGVVLGVGAGGEALGDVAEAVVVGVRVALCVVEGVVLGVGEPVEDAVPVEDCEAVCEGVAVMDAGHEPRVSVEHPTGEFSVALGLDPANPQNVTRAALLRTARLIMRGEVMIPAAVWTGQPA
jgi:2-methylaconitate cis-trans-isomerase PrpF